MNLNILIKYSNTPILDLGIFVIFIHFILLREKKAKGTKLF